MARQLKNKYGRVIYVRMPAEMLKKLDRIAQSKGRSRATHIAEVLGNHVESEKVG